MSGTEHSLLDVPLITARSPGRTARRGLTLPAVFSQLAAGTIGDFPRVAAHQRHPWHAFLVQLAAIALHRANESQIEHSEEDWRELLLNAAGGEVSAFALVEENLSKPAFLQPPVPEGELKGWKPVETPDSLDILITAKSHDVKASRVVRADPESWLMALLSLQTMQGFLGSGNYGIARMNGGFASRPEVGFAPTLEPGPRFVRDVRVLLGIRDETVERFGYADSGGHALLWLVPWDGKGSLGIHECDPFFIEICRRIRFTSNGNDLRCQYRSTKTGRVDAKERAGVLGDPWIPIESSGGKALTVGGSGFTYDRTQRLLWGTEFQKPAAQTPRDSDPLELYFTARVLVRGQGKTEGFHERVLRLPGSVRRRLLSAESTTQLSEVANSWVEHVADIKRKVLKPAILSLVQGGPTQLNYQDRRADALLARFEERVDQRFFDALFAAIESAGEDLEPLKERASAWGAELLDLAETTLASAIDELAIPDARYYRAVTSARRVFYGAARRLGFPQRRELHTPKATHEEVTK